MKPCKFRDLIKRLRAHDKQFAFYAPRGGGSHHVIYHPNIGGRAVSYPVPFHGANAEVKTAYLIQIRTRFQLSKDFFD